MVVCVCVVVVCCGGPCVWGVVCCGLLWWSCVWCVVKLGSLSHLSCSLSFLFSSFRPPSLPHREKSEGTFNYRNISGEEFIFYYSFKLIPKNRRRGKLQSLQFYINSKTIGL